jgi:hypothetical protein
VARSDGADAVDSKWWTGGAAKSCMASFVKSSSVRVWASRPWKYCRWRSGLSDNMKGRRVETVRAEERLWRLGGSGIGEWVVGRGGEARRGVVLRPPDWVRLPLPRQRPTFVQ